MSAIKVEGVSKKFRLQTDKAHSVKELITRRDRSAGVDEFWALRDVSLEIEQGSMFALVGHNGCGKSTLLRCIAGIYRPTEGHVEVKGRISTLLELGAGFHPDLTGRENVYMNATILGMTRRQIDKAFDEIVEFAGVEEFIDSPVKIYSSGMFVRLGFSVAVHVQPEILIVDEVIAVGDEEFQRKCFDHLYDLRKEGTTIVVVTHGMSTVETMCDAAAWLDHGRLMLVGDAGEVASAYMSQINDREQERRTAAAEAAAAADRPAEYVPDTEEWFGEDIAIDGAYFTGADGTSIESAATGEPITLNIEYHAHRPVEEPVFGYMIHSENDIQVTGTNTRIAGVSTGTLMGPGVARLTIPELPLLPGIYDFTIGINDKFVQHTYDRRYRSLPLVVRRGARPLGVGLTEFSGDWDLVEGPHQDSETAS